MNSSTIRRVALGIFRDMLPTDTESGTDHDSDHYWKLVNKHTDDGERVSTAAADREVLAVLKIVGSGRLDSL